MQYNDNRVIRVLAIIKNNLRMEENFTPERRIKELFISGVKKLFLVVVALITYWQLYEYITEKPIIDITIEESTIINSNYKTTIIVENGSQSITSDDVIDEINIILSDTIKQIKAVESKIQPQYQINEKSIKLNFSLLNKNEQFKFYVFSNSRPEIKSVNYRIKDIREINFYDFKNKPKPLKRILNIWIISIIIFLILFIDALLVISKDKGLNEIKSFILNFQLGKNNKKEFIKGYKKIYGKYKLRLKPSKKFMKGIINNLFISFPLKTERDVEFIKFMANLKTEPYIFYRTRTAFIVISPIAFLISILALLGNYYYYEIDFIRKSISINSLNKIVLNLILVLVLIIIIFPRSTMNILLLKKNAKHKF